jgi:hypothetical protein
VYSNRNAKATVTKDMGIRRGETTENLSVLERWITIINSMGLPQRPQKKSPKESLPLAFVKSQESHESNDMNKSDVDNHRIVEVAFPVVV